MHAYAQDKKNDTDKTAPNYVRPATADKPKASTSASKDNFLLGLGIGLDHGGIGFHVLYYPYKYVGGFVAVGYPIIGIGYNAGIKVRYLQSKPNARISPFVTGMYGYNTIIAVANAEKYNKMFYGITVGAGIDLKFKPTHHNYLSLALLVPIRGREVDDYITQLKVIKGMKLNNDLSPVGFSVGFKVPFNLK